MLGAAREHVVGQFQHIVHHQIRRLRDESLRLKPVRHAASRHSGIARGPNVHAAVPHHDGALARRAALAQQRFNPDRIGLLLLEAVPSVNLEEMFGQPQALPQSRG